MKLFASIPQKSVVMNTFLPDNVKKYLEERFEVSYSPFDRHLTNEEIAVYAKDADAILTGWGHCALDAEVLENTKIKVVAHTGGSVGDLVDPKIYEKGIRVLSGNNIYADSVAEGVLAYMFMALRKLPDFVNHVRTGGWHPQGEADYTEGLFNQTVGIIGMGAISKRVIKLLKPFGVSLKLYSGYPIDEEYLKENNASQASLEEIFKTCKIVSLHSAMNERTRGMIGKEHFELLQDGAIFINTARGAIVREDEMIECLKEKRFRAVLDVFCKEPLEAESELRKLENVYCIPHKAGPTMDRRPYVTMRLADDLVKFMRGEEMELEIGGEYASRMTKKS